MGRYAHYLRRLSKIIDNTGTEPSTNQRVLWFLFENLKASIEDQDENSIQENIVALWVHVTQNGLSLDEITPNLSEAPVQSTLKKFFSRANRLGISDSIEHIFTELEQTKATFLACDDAAH